MKLWSDRYPINVKQKGLTRKIRPRHVIVCSNYSIEQCFPSEADWAPLRRRFKVIDFNRCSRSTFCGCPSCKPSLYPGAAYEKVGDVCMGWGPIVENKICVLAVTGAPSPDKILFDIPAGVVDDVVAVAECSPVESQVSELVVPKSVPACPNTHKWIALPGTEFEYVCYNCRQWHTIPSDASDVFIESLNVSQPCRRFIVGTSHAIEGGRVFPIQ
uniref:Uncharacterized protein n=1 Tax=Spongospora subterranea TaxID=70186 RepID=A0A0H5QWX4_9EUKA|eukprot:CRZ06430.1 hypothetical protein [Spongospora subterranea]